MLVRIAVPDEYPLAKALYKINSYGGGLMNDDLVVIALDNNKVIGAVRICTEHGIKILRGMQIKKKYQGKGTGSAMLRFLKQHTDMNGCYCLPYTHLISFYGQIGFEEIKAGGAPAFLAERLGKYLSNGQAVVMMKVNSR